MNISHFFHFLPFWTGENGSLKDFFVGQAYRRASQVASEVATEAASQASQAAEAFWSQGVRRKSAAFVFVFLFFGFFSFF